MTNWDMADDVAGVIGKLQQERFGKRSVPDYSFASGDKSWTRAAIQSCNASPSWKSSCLRRTRPYVW